MRILHVAPSVARAFGGPTYSLAGYSESASDAGAIITIAAPRPPDADSAWLAQRLPNAKFEFFITHGENAFIASPLLYTWLRENGSRFDVIHVHGLLNSVSSSSSRLCVRSGWPVVIRPFGTLSAYTVAHRRGMLKRLYFSMIDRPTLRRASAIHFTTTAERDESLGHGIAWGARAFVIPPPANVNGGSQRGARESSNVVVIARLNPVKRLELLLDAWPIVLLSVPQARLTIAGGGEPAYVRSLREKAVTLGDSVQLVGPVDEEEKRTLLADSDLFALPSFHENFGMAALEALGAGLPVVITEEVQLASFVRESRLGLVTRGSSDELATSVVAALSDQVLRARCRRDGARIVSEFFAPSVIGQSLLQMYQFAIAHPPS